VKDIRMKTPLKPPFSFSAKVPSTAARPSFPARLSGDAVLTTPKFAATAARVAAAAAAAALPGEVKKAYQPEPRSALGMDSQGIRSRMVSRLAAQGISNSQVLAAMDLVERHCFVDSALATQAYEDTSLPIGLGQTISKPSVVARMLELLQQGGVHDASGRLGRVLEIGTGCAYQAAVLSHLATEVYSMERLRGLYDKARENLRLLRLPNVHLLFGDGMAGFPKGAPYAAIIAAAGGEAIPAAWIEQLAVGGRLVAPLQSATGGQALVVIDKLSYGIRQTLLEPVHFVPLKSGTG
jgi:protein-L-isoaspartate(D-aspartate) O-methyltransferase